MTESFAPEIVGRRADIGQGKSVKVTCVSERLAGGTIRRR
jgi:hypothetical protein